MKIKLTRIGRDRIKTLTGKEIELDNIDPTFTIGLVKERIEAVEGVPPVQQRLIFGGKQMYVDCSLSTTMGFAKVGRRTLLTTDMSRRDDWLVGPAPTDGGADTGGYNIDAGAVLHMVLALRGGSLA